MDFSGRLLAHGNWAPAGHFFYCLLSWNLVGFYNVKCQGKSSQKLSGGGGRGDAWGLPLVASSGSHRSSSVSAWMYNLHFTLALSIQSNAKLEAKHWILKTARKSMTYLDILVTLSAWLLLGNLYALATTVSAAPPRFSTWTLHSGKRRRRAMLRRPVNTNLRPPCTSNNEIGELFCYVWMALRILFNRICLEMCSLPSLQPSHYQGLSAEMRFQFKSWVLSKVQSPLFRFTLEPGYLGGNLHSTLNEWLQAGNVTQWAPVPLFIRWGSEQHKVLWVVVRTKWGRGGKTLRTMPSTQ